MFIVTYVSLTVLLCTVSLFLCDIENNDEIEDLDSMTQIDHLKTIKTQEPVIPVPDDKWLVNALQDIAYFLRNHKFNEWDRRFHTKKPEDKLIGFYASFPEPTLNSIHWKVYENCYKDFLKCVTYLYTVIETAPFTRADDITTMLNQRLITNETAIKVLDINCKKALLYTETTGLPFNGPRDKFKWRTSASYYMCWYTMLGIPALSMLGESCDNYANCLDLKFGPRNHDPRADDKLSFACAMYSFCPDPCCKLKHVKKLNECFTKSNPCFIENAKSKVPTHQQCKFERQDNQNLEQIIANNLNVSCHCNIQGFEWKSQFGMCVDINECSTKKHNCHRETENCLNLPGTFRCVCKWGYAYNNEKMKCIPKQILGTPMNNTEDNFSSLLDNLKCILVLLGFY